MQDETLATPTTAPPETTHENPIPLDLWWKQLRDANAWEGRTYAEGTAAQLHFMRYALPEALERRTWIEKTKVMVVGEHQSKSCRLPVYEVMLGDTRVTCRGNFYDWEISVEMPKPLEWLCDVKSRPIRTLEPVFLPRGRFFQGFPPNRRFADYAVDASCWSVSLPYSEHALYNFFWLLNRTLGWIPLRD